MATVELSTGVYEIGPVPTPALDEIQLRERPRMVKENDYDSYLSYLHHMDGIAYLMAFGSIPVPPEWEFPAALEFGGIPPRKGEQGRRADFIQYGIIKTAADAEAVNRAMWPGYTREEEAAAEASFRNSGGRETPPPDSP